MRALVYHGNKDLRLETVSDPKPGPGEVKLRVDYCGICATDIEEYLYGPKFISSDPPNPLTGRSIPLITGHELTATVVEASPGVEGVERGQRTVIDGVLTCGECRWCTSGRTQQCPSMAPVGFGADGGLAEYLVWPASHLVPLPENVTSRESALIEPASVAHHAVRRAGLSSGDRVAVLGVGTVGMLAMQVARAAGATVFAIDTRRMALDLARELGSDATIDASDDRIDDSLAGLTEGLGPDVVIDAAGTADTPALAVEWVRRGGRVVLVAIYTDTSRLDFNGIVESEKEIVGSIAYDRHDVEATVRLLSEGKLRTTPLISDVIGLEEVIEVGFERMLAPAKDVFRILVSPSGEG